MAPREADPEGGVGKGLVGAGPPARSLAAESASTAVAAAAPASAEGSSATTYLWSVDKL